jgi:hypothetical protein
MAPSRARHRGGTRSDCSIGRESRCHVVNASRSLAVRLWSVEVGYLWGIRTEVVVGPAFSLVSVLSPMHCKSIAKASKVRILHLPPRAERALDLRKRRLGPFRVVRL